MIAYRSKTYYWLWFFVLLLWLPSGLGVLSLKLATPYREGLLLVSHIIPLILSLWLIRPLPSLFQTINGSIWFKATVLFGLISLSATWFLQAIMPINNPHATASLLSLPLWLKAVIIILLAPTLEECWFRHWLLQSPAQPKSALSDGFSIGAFALLHGLTAPLNLGLVGLLALLSYSATMGLTLTCIRRQTNHLGLCVLLHSLHNALFLLF
jgi:membrane protease YdiL (CAAX protease family)